MYKVGGAPSVRHFLASYMYRDNVLTTHYGPRNAIVFASFPRILSTPPTMSATESVTQPHGIGQLTDRIGLAADPASDANAIPLQPRDAAVEAESVQPVSGMESEYPSGLQFLNIFVAMTFCLLVVGLDGTIVATAVPSITNHFHTVADVGWYFTSCKIYTSSG